MRHHSLERDHIEYCNYLRECQRLTYQPVRENPAFAPSDIARANPALNDIFHKRPVSTFGNRIWVCDQLTALQQNRDQDYEHIIKLKLSLNRTGPSEISLEGR